MKRLLFLMSLLLVMPSPAASAQIGNVLHVPEDYATISEALSAAPEGARIEIAAGEYVGALHIDRPLSLRGNGVVILRAGGDEAVITIADTYNVRIENLHIEGGEYGIFVTRSQGVRILNNVITGSRLAGIKVRMASARIVGNTIQNALPPYGRGIHITNTTEYPPSQVRENTIISNAASGISTNMDSLAVIENNTLRENGQNGIAVTEMSRAIVNDNLLEGNSQNGVYITDWSTAIVCNNTVTDTRPTAILGSGRYGNGITIDYHSAAQLHNNAVANNAVYGISVVGFSRLRISQRPSSANELWLEDGSLSQPLGAIPSDCK